MGSGDFKVAPCLDGGSYDRNDGEGPSSPDYDTYMELQKKEREMEREMEADVDKKFADHYRGVPGARENMREQEGRLAKPSVDTEYPLCRVLLFGYSVQMKQHLNFRPYYMSFEQVHRPRREYDDEDAARGRHHRPGRFSPDNSDIPGFDDFFAKIERAVDNEIQSSPFQVVK